MRVIENQTHFERARAFATSVGLYDGEGNASLANRLAYLKKLAEKDRTRVRLFPDGAPYSFYFVVERKNGHGTWEHVLNGGLLFHGAHDGMGSGSAPTFACSLTPVTGWAVHT